MQTLVAPLINLLILIGVLAYYLKEPLRSFVTERHASIRDELAAVRNQLKSAKEKHEEFSSKLRAMDAEIAGLKNQATQDAAAVRANIIKESQRLSANIISDAKSASVVLFSEFKSQLYVELGGRVLDRAEALLRDRLTGDDRDRIRKEFSTQLDRVGTSG